MAKSSDGSTNFIPVNRRIFEHEFWEEKRVFSKFEAWIDLLQTARYEKEERTDWINNKPVKYGRGEIPASIRFLQKRWNWGSITKVERFLSVLENKDMVVLKKGQSQMVVSICKYDVYNPLKIIERTVKGQQQGQQKDESNKERNKEYNTNSIGAPDVAKKTFEEREKEFRESLVPFTKYNKNPNGLYDKDMVKEFYDHWREPNKSRTKMLWETKPTWDTSLRLARWKRNGFGVKKENLFTSNNTSQGSAPELTN